MDLNVSCFPTTTCVIDTANASWPLVMNLMGKADHGAITVFMEYAAALSLASQLRIACGAEEVRTLPEVVE